MKIFSLIVIFAVYAGVSCTQPGGSSLESRTTDRNDEDDNDGGDRERRDSRSCSSRDSCQDICDDMFEYTTERYNCYELTSGEVNTVSRVWDEFSNDNVESSELEDLDPDDVKAYLDIGFESFVDLVAGKEVGEKQWDSDDMSANSQKILQWIAEESDIAGVILEQDSHFTLGLELFLSLAGGASISNTVPVSPSDRGNCNSVSIGDDVVTCGSGSSSGRRLFDLRGFSKAKEFLKGFADPASKFSGDRFMTFAADERNDTAFEWGHKTLLEFCKDAVDENEDDVDTKTCLQTVYCIHRTKEEGTPSGEGIFEELKDHNDVVGQTDEDDCEDLDDEDDMEDLFQ